MNEGWKRSLTLLIIGFLLTLCSLSPANGASPRHCPGRRIPQTFPITIRKDLPSVILALYKYNSTGKSADSNDYWIGCVEVSLGSSSTPQQVLTLTEPIFTQYYNDQDNPIDTPDIRNEDYNLDGYHDLSILSFEAAHGEAGNFWLWNPSTHSFEYNSDLSRDMNVEVDKNSRAIWTRGSSSVYDTHVKEYLLDHGKVVWVLSADQKGTYAPPDLNPFPVIEKFQLALKGRPQPVLKLVYTDASQFDDPCQHCQTANDLKGCKLIGYGKIVGAPGEKAYFWKESKQCLLSQKSDCRKSSYLISGDELLVFDSSDKDFFCGYYASQTGKTSMGLLRHSTIDLKGY